MKTNYILTTLATASLVVGGQALAQGRGGGHGQGHGVGGVGVGLGTSTRGGIGVGVDRDRINADVGIRTRTDARLQSRGPERANPRARARANSNSVLATGRTAVDLSSLTPGLVVRDSAGARIGTVARINRASDGRIVNVLVRDTSGRTIPLAPNSLTISGGVVTTTNFTVDD